MDAYYQIAVCKWYLVYPMHHRFCPKKNALTILVTLAEVGCRIDYYCCTWNTDPNTHETHTQITCPSLPP